MIKVVLEEGEDAKKINGLGLMRSVFLCVDGLFEIRRSISCLDQPLCTSVHGEG